MPKSKSSKSKGRSPNLTHFDANGTARMVDVSAKPVTIRTAVATGTVQMLPATLQVIRAGSGAKGDVLQVARLAGIMASKQTAQLIPLCHTIPLASVEIEFAFSDEDCLHISATTKAEHKTGVEMEALTAISVAALTVQGNRSRNDDSLDSIA
jgi:cyclic pyranopterin monophosphate synthase